MEFKNYGKIHRLGKAETEGILDGYCVVQEKIDGANLSVWLGDDDKVIIASRNRIIPRDEADGQFSKVYAHIEESGAVELLRDAESNQEVRLYGEWLVKHTIGDYNKDAYNKFYLFDIETEGEFMHIGDVKYLAKQYAILFPQIFAEGEGLKEDQILPFVGKTNLGAKHGEGVVIKNIGFINKFGHRSYAKIVRENFKEENMVVFGNHFKDSEEELKIANKFVTEGRVRKIIKKIEINEDEDIEMKHIGLIIRNTFYDIVTEEITALIKVGVIDFKKLNKYISKRVGILAKDIIMNSEDISIAFKN